MVDSEMELHHAWMIEFAHQVAAAQADGTTAGLGHEETPPRAAPRNWSVSHIRSLRRSYLFWKPGNEALVLNVRPVLRLSLLRLTSSSATPRPSVEAHS